MSSESSTKDPAAVYSHLVKTKVVEPRFLSIEDIQFWVQVGSVSPSVDTLRRVLQAVKRVQAKSRNKTAYVYWLYDGRFEVYNQPFYQKKKSATNPKTKDDNNQPATKSASEHGTGQNPSKDQLPVQSKSGAQSPT